MKIAAPLCRNRIAPLFDIAETFALFDAQDTGRTPTQTVTFDANHGDTVRLLLDTGVETARSAAPSRAAGRTA